MITITPLRRGLPTAPLDVDPRDALLLLEALGDLAEKHDRMGCLRDVADTRQLLRRVQDVARLVALRRTDA